MSKNNLIKKSDKKFIRTEKARIRREFLDIKKQQELINNLYKKFEKNVEMKEVTTKAPEIKEAKVKEVKPTAAKSSGVAKKVKKEKAAK